MGESALAGETFPFEKTPGTLPADTKLALRANTVFMGPYVISGTATIIAVHTGTETIFGGLSNQLKTAAPETDFERGIERVGYMPMEIMMILIVVILAINLLLKKPVLDTLLLAWPSQSV